MGHIQGVPLSSTQARGPLGADFQPVLKLTSPRLLQLVLPDSEDGE